MSPPVGPMIQNTGSRAFRAVAVIAGLVVVVLVAQSGTRNQISPANLISEPAPGIWTQSATRSQKLRSDGLAPAIPSGEAAGPRTHTASQTPSASFNSGSRVEPFPGTQSKTPSARDDSLNGPVETLSATPSQVPPTSGARGNDVDAVDFVSCNVESGAWFVAGTAAAEMGGCFGGRTDDVDSPAASARENDGGDESLLPAYSCRRRSSWPPGLADPLRSSVTSQVARQIVVRRRAAALQLAVEARVFDSQSIPGPPGPLADELLGDSVRWPAGVITPLPAVVVTGDCSARSALHDDFAHPWGGWGESSHATYQQPPLPGLDAWPVPPMPFAAQLAIARAAAAARAGVAELNASALAGLTHVLAVDRCTHHPAAGSPPLPSLYQPWLPATMSFRLTRATLRALSRPELRLLARAAGRTCEAMSRDAAGRRAASAAWWAEALRDGLGCSADATAAVDVRARLRALDEALGEGGRDSDKEPAAAAADSDRAAKHRGLKEEKEDEEAGVTPSRSRNASAPACTDSTAKGGLAPPATLLHVTLNVVASDAAALRHVRTERGSTAALEGVVADVARVTEDGSGDPSVLLAKLAKRLRGMTLPPLHEGGVLANLSCLSALAAAAAGSEGPYALQPLPWLGMDERYSLTMRTQEAAAKAGIFYGRAAGGTAAGRSREPPSGIAALVSAPTVWGALGGLRALRQAVSEWGLLDSRGVPVATGSAALQEALEAETTARGGRVDCGAAAGGQRPVWEPVSRGCAAAGDPPRSSSGSPFTACVAAANTKRAAADAPTTAASKAETGGGGCSSVNDPLILTLKASLSPCCAAAAAAGLGLRLDPTLCGSPSTAGAATAAASDAVRLVAEALDPGVPLPVQLPLTVSDAPWRPWRGFSIDTGRHWHSVSSLRAHVDAMAAAGLNTLHWHVADAQSWPLALSVAPELAEVGGCRGACCRRTMIS